MFFLPLLLPQRTVQLPLAVPFPTTRLLTATAHPKPPIEAIWAKVGVRGGVATVTAAVPDAAGGALGW